MSPTAASPWSPFGQRVFAVIWTATLISNIGGWMYAAAAGWLMTSLDSSPLVVSLVQVAATLPIFLFAMPAGALTDSLDKRRFLLWGEGFIAVTSALMAGLVWLDPVTASRLLVLAFLASAGGADWAVLPLVARCQLAGGPTRSGILLGGSGASAVAGAFALPWLNTRLGRDRLAVAGALGTAAATALFGLAHGAATALLASAIAGVSWIGGLSSLNVSALVALPEWVRGRGSALYVTVMFGALTLGSLIWGEVASSLGLAPALFVAAAGGAIAVLAQRRWQLQTSADLDLAPAMPWAPAVTTRDFDPNRRLVLVTVRYHNDPKNGEPFHKA